MVMKMLIIAKESNYQIVHIIQIFDNWYILRWYKKNHTESLRKILKIKIHCRTLIHCMFTSTYKWSQTTDHWWSMVGNILLICLGREFITCTVALAAAWLLSAGYLGNTVYLFITQRALYDVTINWPWALWSEQHEGIGSPLILQGNRTWTYQKIPSSTPNVDQTTCKCNRGTACEFVI